MHPHSFAVGESRKAGRRTYWIAGGQQGNAPEGTCFWHGANKAEGVRAAKEWMENHAPLTDYASCQLVPYKGGQRDWSQKSLRWVPHRGGWTKGEGIK